MKFIDIHNHILYGIDDGSKTKENTVQMLKKAEEDGIEKLIFTPHFMEKRFENTKEMINAKVSEIKSLVEEHQINIDLYFGSEVFISKNTEKLLHQNTIKTMNDSRYVLVETHRMKIYQRDNISDLLYNVSVDGYLPIIAHPERYEFVHENPNVIYEFVKEGYYIQLNANCFSNPKKPAYKIAKKLLDNRLVHFIASDAHDLVFRPPVLSEAYQWVNKRYGEVYANDLFYNNPLKVIQDEKIISKDYREIKKKMFSLF